MWLRLLRLSDDGSRWPYILPQVGVVAVLADAAQKKIAKLRAKLEEERKQRVSAETLLEEEKEARVSAEMRATAWARVAQEAGAQHVAAEAHPAAAAAATGTPVPSLASGDTTGPQVNTGLQVGAALWDQLPTSAQVALRHDGFETAEQIVEAELTTDELKELTYPAGYTYNNERLANPKPIVMKDRRQIELLVRRMHAGVNLKGE